MLMKEYVINETGDTIRVSSPTDKGKLFTRQVRGGMKRLNDSSHKEVFCVVNKTGDVHYAPYNSFRVMQKDCAPGEIRLATDADMQTIDGPLSAYRGKRVQIPQSMVDRWVDQQTKFISRSAVEFCRGVNNSNAAEPVVYRKRGGKAVKPKAKAKQKAMKPKKVAKPKAVGKVRKSKK